jgi:hypothetical protein
MRKCREDGRKMKCVAHASGISIPLWIVRKRQATPYIFMSDRAPFVYVSEKRPESKKKRPFRSASVKLLWKWEYLEQLEEGRGGGRSYAVRRFSSGNSTPLDSRHRVYARYKRLQHFTAKALDDRWTGNPDESSLREIRLGYSVYTSVDVALGKALNEGKEGKTLRGH